MYWNSHNRENGGKDKGKELSLCVLHISTVSGEKDSTVNARSTPVESRGLYPNLKPTQRIGIVPDVVAKPTLAGIIAGRDEVLETGIRQILGTAIPEPEIEHMAQPSH